MSVVIRSAVPGDAALILALIRELADYEKLLHEVEASEDDISRDLFGTGPRVFCDVAEYEGKVAAFALWFYTYSTFQGRHGIYLEDLFVRPACRGKGLGLALVRHLARRCRDEGLGRFQWSVLDWNEPAIRFYTSIGARPVEGWTMMRVTGAELERLAEDRP